MSEVNFTFRLEEQLKAEFLAAAKQNDRNGSQEIRDFMRRYIAATTGSTAGGPAQATDTPATEPRHGS
jgi:hypothetical protein